MSDEPTSTAPNEIPPEMQRIRQLQQMLNGYHVTQLLHVAARLGLADRLVSEPLSADELAAATGANADALYRVMRALASLGVFAETTEHTFTLTPLAELLRQDHSYSVRAQALFLGGGPYRAWADLLHTVMTGETAFDHVFGAHHFAYLAEHPDASAEFNASMSASSRRAATAVVAAYDFSLAHTVVDIGGGHGTLLAAVLWANPELHGILFDEEHVVAGATSLLEAAGVADRCERVGGNFFKTAPASADLYMMRHILHDWDDERCVAILGACVQAMAPGGKVLAIESVIAPGNDPSPAKFLDLQMLVMNGGRERTAEEYRQLYTASGLTLTRIIPAGVESLIEGVRA